MFRRTIILYTLLLALLAACGQAISSVPPTVSRTTASPAVPLAASPQASPIATPTSPTGTSPVAEPRITISDTLVLDGSSTVFPITEAVIRAYSSIAPNVRIQLGVSGTSGGFKKFCSGEIVIAEASRPIKQTEVAECQTAGIRFIELPVAFDGISVIINRQNTWATCLTTAELKRLWEPAAQGQILRWNQIRADWPDQPITLYGAGTDSGTYDYFTSAIVGEEGVSRKDYTGSEDDYLLGQDLATDRNGLGFFGYSYYLEFQNVLNLVAIDSGAGCVAPSAQSITDGSYAPLSRPLFLYIRADALDRPALHSFVEFYLTHAAQIVPEARCIPLTPRIYELTQRRFDRRVLGSVFKGGSQVGLSLEALLALEEQ